MKIDISDDRDNPFMKRKELRISIDHTEAATPSKAALQQLVAKELSADVESVDIRNVFSHGGAAKAEASVYVWEEKKVDDLSKAAEAAKNSEKGEKGGEEEDKKEEKGGEKEEPAEAGKEEPGKGESKEKKKDEKSKEEAEEAKGESTGEEKEEKKKEDE